MSLVDKVADAVLYEGYILYPYRATAVKNQQRFNFGALFPPAFTAGKTGSDASLMQTECLARIAPGGSLDVRVRFLQIVSRQVGRFCGNGDAANNADASATLSADSMPCDHWPCENVDSLEVEGRIYSTWQEAVEREVSLPGVDLAAIQATPRRQSFSFEPGYARETLRAASGQIVGMIARRQEAITGIVTIAATRLEGSLFQVRVTITNQTPLPKEPGCYAGAEAEAEIDRDAALLHALVSTHTILEVRGGEFVSLLDPPEELRAAVAQCKNIGAWPVMAGDPDRRDTMLSSPIILYDYPQIAPESPGNLCDGTEIDEILLLRIMTLTDDEKRQMRDIDDRARVILERTELMPPEQFMKLHGAIRGLRPTGETA